MCETADWIVCYVPKGRESSVFDTVRWFKNLPPPSPRPLGYNGSLHDDAILWKCGQVYFIYVPNSRGVSAMAECLAFESRCYLLDTICSPDDEMYYRKLHFYTENTLSTRQYKMCRKSLDRARPQRSLPLEYRRWKYTLGVLQQQGTRAKDDGGDRPYFLLNPKALGKMRGFDPIEGNQKYCAYEGHTFGMWPNPPSDILIAPPPFSSTHDDDTTSRWPVSTWETELTRPASDVSSCSEDEDMIAAEENEVEMMEETPVNPRKRPPPPVMVEEEEAKRAKWE